MIINSINNKVTLSPRIGREMFLVSHFRKGCPLFLLHLTPKSKNPSLYHFSLNFFNLLR